MLQRCEVEREGIDVDGQRGGHDKITNPAGVSLRRGRRAIGDIVIDGVKVGGVDQRQGSCVRDIIDCHCDSIFLTNCHPLKVDAVLGVTAADCAVENIAFENVVVARRIGADGRVHAFIDNCHVLIPH